MNIPYAFDYFGPIYITPPELRSIEIEEGAEDEESCLCPCPCSDDKKKEQSPSSDKKIEGLGDEEAVSDKEEDAASDEQKTDNTERHIRKTKHRSKKEKDSLRGCEEYKGILEDVFAQTYEKEINEMQEAEMLFNLTELSYRLPFTLELHKIKERLPEKSRSIMILQEPQITTIINENGKEELVTLKPDYLILYEKKYLIVIETKALGKLREKMSRFEKDTIIQLERYTNLAPFVILTDYNLFWIYNDETKPATEHTIQHVTKKEGRCSDLGLYIVRILDKFSKLARKRFDPFNFISYQVGRIKKEILSGLKDSEIFSIRENIIYDYFVKSKLLHVKSEELDAKSKELLKDDFADEIALSIVHSIFLSKILLSEWSWNNNGNESFLDRLAENLPNSLNSIKELLSNFKNIINQVHKNKDKKNRYVEDIWNYIQEVGLELWGEELRGVIEKSENLFIEFRKRLLAKYYPRIITGKDVYYIPEEIVDFMVRLSEKILIEKLKLRDGLADSNVVILEPTAGIGFFATKVIEILQEKIYKRSNKNLDLAYEEYLKEINGILNRIFAFETNFYGFMFALTNFVNKVANFSFYYRGAKIKKSFEEKSEIEKWKEILSEKTINFFHENILKRSSYLDKTSKVENKTFLIIGAAPLSKNPIYNTEDASRLIENYGASELIENYEDKNNLNLGAKYAVNANYVKFIAFAEDEIRRKEKGVVAYITNSNFLSSQYLAEMRKKLLTTFDYIYIIDLKNRTKKVRITEDKNVLNISSGVCIFFGVKGIKKKILKNNENKDNNCGGRVFYASWEEINAFEKTNNKSIYDALSKSWERRLFKEIKEPCKNSWIYKSEAPENQLESLENQPESTINDTSLESRFGSNLGYKRTKYFIIS